MQRPASPPASGHGPRRGADPSPTVSWQIPRRRRRGVLAGVLLAVFAGLPRRRKTIAVLRALGAPRLYGVLALWLEVFLQLLLGGLLGLALGWGGTFWGLRLLAAHTGVAAQVSLEGAALVSLGLCLAAGSLAALLPAWSCGRAPVARTLRE